MVSAQRFHAEQSEVIDVKHRSESICTEYFEYSTLNLRSKRSGAKWLELKRSFTIFGKSSDIPQHFIREQIKQTGRVTKIEPSQLYGPLLVVQHHPPAKIFFWSNKTIPIKIDGIDINANGYSWLQSVVDGKQVSFVPMKQWPNENHAECRVYLTESKTHLDIGEALLSLGFAKLSVTVPKSIRNRKDAHAVALYQYYRTLDKAERYAKERRNGLNYAMPGQNTSNGCCRLCFKGNCHLQELFPGGYTEELLISKIFECTTVEITFANDPDALICYSCVAKIEEFHRYREQCRSNDVQHKNSKRRMDGKMHPVLASTLIPPKYVKKEIDSDGFEISASEFYPVDAADQSYGTLETSVDDGPIARIANLSGVMDSTIPNEDGVRNSGEDENLLELMPDQRHDEFSVSYSDMNEGYENNNEIFCELPIKEEPQDINDDTDDWHDFGMHDDDDQMDRSTNLIPLIDNCSYSTNSEHDSDEQRTYREVYNGTDLVCLMQDGFLYVQVNKQQWRCRIQSCGAAVYQFEYSQELETNGVNHAHSREVENSATDMEILRLVENGSPPPLMEEPKPSRTIGANTAEVRTPTKENRDVNGDESVGKKLSSTGTESNTSTPSTIRNKVHIATHKPIASSSGTSATSSNTGQTAKVSSKLQHMHNYRIIKNKKGNKALVHGGFRYCKVRTRQDGAISWFCRMNKKTCHVGLYQYPDGKLEWINNNRHNHNPTDPIELPKKVVPAVKKSQPFHMDDETFVNNEWYFVRNRKNGTTLIHAGYRYHKKASRVDKTSMWRCSRASRGCRAGIVMHADETIAKLDNFDHDHPAPNALLDGETIIGGDLDESIEESPNTSTADIQANFKPELNLVNFNGCIEEQDDPEANMRTLLSTMLDVSDEPKNKSPCKKIVLSPSKAHYRYVKNRRLTQSLVFRGYRYSRSSMQIRADGSVKWVCQMNKKTCRVAVKVLKDGSLEMDGQKHNHPQLVEDMEENDDNEDEGDGNDTNVSIHDSTIDNDSTIHQEDEMDKEAAHDYYFALNRSNGTSLIFQRNRYSKENTRPDGSTIWRCMVRSDCVSKVILHADGTCAVYRNPTHHHPPLEELPKALHYTDKLSSVSVKSPPVEKPTTTKLTVKGDMLIYKLNRMKKVKSFSDGTAIFKCAEMDSCPSKVKLQYEETEDGRSSTKVIFESAHNHQSFLTDTLITNSSSTRANGKSKVKSALKMQRHSTSDSVENVKDYQLFTNNRGHVSLVYEGYRFSLRGHGVNGNTSWKCRANRTCSAYVTFTEEGRVVRAVDQVDVMPHNHAINGEYIERAVPIELHELHPPAANLSQFVSNWMNGLYKNELGAKTISTLQPSISHNDGKKTMYHKNFSYKLQTIKNGREFWRCTMFKARACRAALFCYNNGTIIQHENGHEHNHEPIKSLVTASQQNNSERKSYSSLKGKTHVDESSDAFYGANETFDTINEVRKTVKRSHSSMLYDDQLVDESSCAPAYQIVEKDGVKMLHHEKHRYVVILDKREGNTDERKRWRCSLWNSRHQCPVELTVLDSGELHFETDLTHNHRPPPPESQEVDRVPALNTKGTKKYELLGRNLKTVFYKGHKFFWKEQRNNWTFYACMCALSYECTVTVKIDSNGMLYECSNESHNHSPTLQPDQANESPTLKRLSEKVKASREARLANCPKNGSDDYSFVGNSLASKGYRYWLHNKLSCGLCVYRCRQQKAKGCNGSVYMDKDTQLIYQRYDAKHNHEPLPEDKIANTETPVASSSSSDSCKPVRPISPQPAMAPHSTDNEDDHDLLPASAIESNEPQTELPKNDDVILTPNYTFVKNYLNKNQLLYEDYLYEFVPLSYRNGSDKFYGCLFSECSASVKLLPCGNLKVLKANQHTHERPDLTDYRDVGCGSANFTTLVPPGSGKKAKILFEGYMYYDDNSQPFQDDAKVFYCYSNVSTKEKSKSNERCSVSLELLPNNRVIVTGTHNHPEPKLTDSGTSEKSHSKLIVLHGRSFRYLKTEADGTVVWQCFDDPKCKAKVYEKPNGKMVCGTIKHVLRHAMTKLTNNSATEFKISLPTSAAVTSAKVVPKPAAASSLLSSASNSIVPCSTGSLRTKWYQGNRYNFYLTRRDGVQYWRCSKRIEEKCETGILCYPSGTIVPYNSLPHTHPPLNAAAEELRDNVPSSPYTPKDVAKLDPNDQVTETVSKYPLQNPDTSTPNDLFVRYKGVLYTLRKRNTDGLRIYRCRNQPCTHTLIVNERGKIISKKPTWHSCVKQPGADALVTATSNAFSRSASGLGFDKPEIEDPDDLVDQNGSTTMEPLLKRIRLDIEMVEENDHSTAPEEIVQTEDSLSGMFNTETDAVMEEELIEESYGEMQHCLNAENEASDTWEQDYLEQEFDSPDAIEDATANSETDVRRPNDGDQTHEIQTTSEHSRESCAPKASLKVGTN
uniref:ZAD domain-containing protein n=1 Tax=Anopheles culicifacies TaxID=139723 RepID=A0A182M6G2_9DIPT